LSYWCEHSEVPITFDDRRGREAQAPVDDDDPFAAFAEATVAPATIQRPLDLPDAVLVERHREPGLELIVGLTEHPRYGFYNGGLTLLNTANEDALGDLRHGLRHLAFKVKSDRLEHTLTRDNVLQDEAWRACLLSVRATHRRLQASLLARVEAAARDGEPLSAWHEHLAREIDASPDLLAKVQQSPVLRDVAGQPWSPAAAHQQERRVGALVTGAQLDPLHEALHAMGVRVTVDSPGTRELLARTTPPPRLPALPPATCPAPCRIAPA
jgi:hypothetical protein